MSTVRCLICLKQLPTLRNLTHHYLSAHSKSKIVKLVLRLSILQSTPNLLQKYKTTRKVQKRTRFVNDKTETLYLNDNIHILCGRNEIIIGDENSSVTVKFPFDKDANSSSECKENWFRPFKSVECKKRQSKRLKQIKANQSEDGNGNSIPKRKNFETMRHYRINITKLKQNSSLNETNGDFYICNCRDKLKKTIPKTHLKILTSDTESDNGKQFISSNVDPKVFCSKCGNGYRNETDLFEHMKIHELHCRVCNQIFPTEFLFKEHIQGHLFKVYMCHICDYEFLFKHMLMKHYECHMEEQTIESVLDMEEDYQLGEYSNATRYTFADVGYHNSINSILYFLNEHENFYYAGGLNSKFAKIVCDICSQEMALYEYDRHVQGVHHSYVL